MSFLFELQLISYTRLNQCVGELNHKYFLSFLVINSVFLLYATYVVSLVLLSEVRHHLRRYVASLDDLMSFCGVN